MEIKNNSHTEKIKNIFVSFMTGLGIGFTIYLYQLIYPITQSSFIQMLIAIMGCLLTSVIVYYLAPLIKNIIKNINTIEILIRIIGSVFISFIIFLIIDYRKPLPVGEPGEHNLEILIPESKNDSDSPPEYYIKINEVKIGNEKINLKRFEQIDGQFVNENQELYTRMPGKLRYIYTGNLSTSISILFSYKNMYDYNEIIVGVDGKHLNYFLPRGNNSEQLLILIYPPLFQICKILYIMSSLYFIAVVSLIFFVIFSLNLFGRKTSIIYQAICFLNKRILSLFRCIFLSLEKIFKNDNKIDILTLIIVIGFTCAVVYHYIQGAYLHRPFPQNTFLFHPDNRFEDFYNLLKGSEDLDPFRPDKMFFTGGYFPFGYLVSFLFSLITPQIISWFVLILSFFFSLFFILKYFLYEKIYLLNSRQFLSLFSLMFLTYPILFAVDRSNLDMVICILFFLFVLCYKSNKFILSTIFLGMATAIKPFTGLFILVYVYDKKYREACILLINLFLLTVISLSVFKDGLIFETQKFLFRFFAFGKLNTEGSISRFASDFYNLLTILSKNIIIFMGRATNPLNSDKFKLVYFVLIIIIFCFFVIDLWVRHQQVWKTLFILSSLIILLPYVTYDYRLIYLFPPLVLFLKKDENETFDILITILWGILLIPKNYSIFGGEQNVGMLANPLIIIMILFLVLFNQPFKRCESASTN